MVDTHDKASNMITVRGTIGDMAYEVSVRDGGLAGSANIVKALEEMQPETLEEIYDACKRLFGDTMEIAMTDDVPVEDMQQAAGFAAEHGATLDMTQTSLTVDDLSPEDAPDDQSPPVADNA